MRELKAVTDEEGRARADLGPDFAVCQALADLAALGVGGDGNLTGPVRSPTSWGILRLGLPCREKGRPRSR